MDEETIRLNVSPEVSTIDESIGTSLVPGGSPTPGINTRKVNTTVEMREGETLALAGLLEVALDAQTTRIPGLGDLPYLGPFFSNTTHQRVERELLILVTPFFVSATDRCEELRLPGQDLQEPNDLEFYFLNRIIHLIIIARRVVRCEKNDFIEQGDVYFIKCEIEYFFYKCGTGVWNKKCAYIF